MLLYEALDLPILKPGRLLTDPALGRNREISSVAVIEVPVGQFIRSGEFVISTGMNVGRDSRRLARFVKDVAAGGAAALALAVGPYTPRIPKRIVDAAGSERLPLIELPWEVRFSEISEAILRRLIQDQTAIRTLHDFVWSLASGNIRADAASARAKQLRIDLKKRFVGVFARCTQDQVQLVEKACAHSAAQRGVEWLSIVAGDSVIGYLQSLRNRQQLHAMLQSIRAPGGISWGVGRLCREFDDFHQSYEDSRIACEIGSRVRGEGAITDISDVLADRILLNLARHSDVVLLLERYVDPLQAFRRMALLGTIEAFFAADGNASETARRLSITRQAVLYRLAKVESLLRVDLSSAEHRFAISLALRMRRLQQAAGSAKLLS